jgi:hypothetical protein
MSHHEAAALDVPTLVAKYVYPGRFLMTNELFLDIRTLLTVMSLECKHQRAKA